MNIYFYSYKSVPESYKAVAPWDHAEIDISRLSAGTTYGPWPRTVYEQ